MDFEQAPQIYADLVRLIQDAPFERPPWRRFIRNFRRVFPASTVGMTLQQPATIRPLLLFTMEGDFDNTVMMERYLNRYSQQDPFPYQDLEPDRIYTLPELLGDGWEDASYHREFLRPFGFHHMLLVRLVVPNEVNAFMNVGRSASAGPFSTAEMAYFSRLLPDLRHGLRVSTAFKHFEAERLLYENAVEAMGIGTILLGAAGQVVYSSPVASVLLTHHDVLRLRNGHLTCTRASDRRQLDHIVEQALADRTGEFSRALPLSSGGLLLAIRAVTYPLSVSDEPGPRVAIFLSDRGMRPAFAREVICGLFGLSPAEADLSIKLTEGASLAEAAALLGISEHTARTYSKRIYAKTGTCRQAELVQLILASVARLSGPAGALS